MDWRDFLDGWHPRGDVYDDFPPRHLDDLQPALLNETDLLNAAAVAARVMQIVAQRGGTRLKSDQFDALLARVQSNLPDSAQNQCDDEAARVLQWLESAEQVEDEDLADSGLPPELDVMMASDIESRVSVAQFAINDGYDLELEYFDEERQVWPRIYCTPVSLLGLDELDEATEADADEDSGNAHSESGESDLTDIELVVERAGQTRYLPIRTVRWLMPVSKRDAAPTHSSEEKDSEPAEVVDFPGLDETDKTDSEQDSSGDTTDDDERR